MHTTLTEIDKLLDGQRRRVELGVKVEELLRFRRSRRQLGLGRCHLRGRIP